MRLPILEPFSGLKIADLMRLVAREGNDFGKVIEKAYEWEHCRRLEIGKWSLASAAAIVAGALTLMTKGQPQNQAIVPGAGIIAGLLFSFGLAAIISARSIAKRYSRTLELAQRMAESRPFFRLLQQKGEL